MSIEVDPQGLAEAASRYRFAYLLTVGDGVKAHVVAVQPVVADGQVRVSQPGRSSLRNAEAQHAVTLVWPPQDPAEYSLIVDGTAAVEGEGLTVSPTRAVLHRPAPAPAPDAACAADCVELAHDRTG